MTGVQTCALPIYLIQQPEFPEIKNIYENAKLSNIKEPVSRFNLAYQEYLSCKEMKERYEEHPFYLELLKTLEEKNSVKFKNDPLYRFQAQILFFDYVDGKISKEEAYVNLDKNYLELC